jgi:hypothetical protein
MEWHMYLAVIAIGFVSGFINTLAGGGSALSLPLLIFLGLPANVANGTNRIAILFQSAVSTHQFHKRGAMDFRKGIPLGLVSLAGSIFGAAIAVNLNEILMNRIIGVVLVMMLMLVVFKPGIWLQSREHTGQSGNRIVSFILFFLVGIYGGFIQVGVGFFLLGSLVLVERFNLVKANAIKILIVLLYTPAALLVFILNKQVDFKLGFVLAAGSMIGGWLGTRIAVSWGPKFVRWVLIISLVGSAIKLFDVM